MLQPPVVLRQDRLKLGLQFALLATLAAALALGAYVATFLRDALWANLGVTFLVPLALAAAAAATAAGWSLFHPATLTLDEAALTYRAYWYERRYPWRSIAAFYVLSPGPRTRVPACELREAVGGRRHVSFGRSWEKNADDMVDLLKAAKATWDAGDAPTPPDAPDDAPGAAPSP